MQGDQRLAQNARAVNPQGTMRVASVGTPPTHIPDDPADLITSKQGYSDQKLARNHNAKNLIELRILYMRTPGLYPEGEVDLRAQGAPGAGTWLSLPLRTLRSMTTWCSKTPRDGR
jgi:hypothetical protein